MEAQIFMPDGERFVLHRSAHPHGSDRQDPKHQYLMCDVNTGEMTVMTDELGTTGPSISPDGKWLAYFADLTTVNGGTLSLKRVRTDGTGRETIMTVDGPLPGTSFRPSKVYPLSTISSDGKRIAISCFLGDGTDEGATWGLMVFDIEAATVRLILEGRSWCNIHPQYSRSLDTEASHGILVQENHGCEFDARGATSRSVSPPGADIHVIRDDGTNFRDMPWGRDGHEGCQGHQCWRGRSEWAITSTGIDKPGADGERTHVQELIEGLATEHADHRGLKSPGAVRNDLSRSFAGTPRFCHFATDINAKHFITDYRGSQSWQLYDARFGKVGDEPLKDFRYLLDTRSSLPSTSHIHPFTSPDGSLAFFNSNESGILQAYMVRGR